MAQVTCPSCGAVLEIEAAPGTEFDCGACGAAMTMPDEAPARPAAPRGPAQRPAGGARPAAAGGRPAAGGARPAAAGGARRPAPAGRGAAPSGGGDAAQKQKVIVFAALGVVVLGVVAFFALRGGDEPAPTPPPAPKPVVAPKVEEPASKPAPVVQKPKPVKRPPRPNDLRDKAGALRWDMEAPDAKADAFATFATFAARAAAEFEVEGDAEAAAKSAKEAHAAAEGALKLDPDNAVARAMLGFVRFDKAEAQRMLGESWMRPFFKAEVEITLPEVDREAGSPGKPVWLDCKDGPQKDVAIRWREIVRRAERWKKTALDPENDRFAKAAMKRFNELETEVGAKLKKAGSDGASSFEVYTFKPYALYIQKDKNDDGDRIAEQWIDLLEEVKKTFFLRFQKRHGLDELDEITPVLVLRNFAEYNKYQGDKKANSAAHFEPGTGRLVTWVGATGKQNVADDYVDPSGMTVKYIRGSVFHEATHQLVHFITRTGGRQAAGGQAMWFSEGIADYFGFHSRHLDPETGRWRYTLGKVSDERISSLKRLRKDLMPFADLLDYLRSDWTSDNAILYGDGNRPKTANEFVRAQRRTALAYAQGWSLTYFLNEYGNRKYRDKFDEYLKGERFGQSGPSAFRKAFGNDYSQMEKEYFSMVDEFIEALNEKRIENGEIKPKGGSGK